MSVLSLPATGHTHIYVSGDVSIDETAAIAPGVILQASGEGRIIIKAGACLGMGTVLTATQGTIEIGEGAILGAGVLIVGYGKISDRVCIGSASTLIETSVESMQLISPGSLLGDSSRQEESANSETEQEPTSNVTPSESEQQQQTSSAVSDTNGSSVNSEPKPEYWASFPSTSTEEANNGSKSQQAAASQPEPDYWASSPSTPTEEANNGSNSQQVPNSQTATHQSNTAAEENSSSEQQSPSTASNGKIYGQTHIERLMVTLFPHKEYFKNNNTNNNNDVE